MRKQYISLLAKCKEIPLKNGTPLDFTIGETYTFAQIGLVFTLYQERKGTYFQKTDVRLGYKQFNKCFERLT